MKFFGNENENNNHLRPFIEEEFYLIMCRCILYLLCMSTCWYIMVDGEYTVCGIEAKPKILLSFNAVELTKLFFKHYDLNLLWLQTIG